MKISRNEPTGGDAETVAREIHAADVRRLVKPGDILTHTRCLGCLEEHVFDGYDGAWMCGWPTADTKRVAGVSQRSRGQYANDIAPSAVTHINRTPIDVAKMLAEQNTPNAPESH